MSDDAEFMIFQDRHNNKFEEYFMDMNTYINFGVWVVSNFVSKEIYRFNNEYDASCWGVENWKKYKDKQQMLEPDYDTAGWTIDYTVCEKEYGFLARMGYTQMN